jgi:hypothetical protein
MQAYGGRIDAGSIVGKGIACNKIFLKVTSLGIRILI